MARRKKEGPSVEQRMKGVAAVEATRKARKINKSLSNVRSDSYDAGLSYVGGKGGKKRPFVDASRYSKSPEVFKTVAGAEKSNLEAGIREGNPLKYAPNLDGLRNDALRARDAGDFESAQKLADISKFYSGYKAVWGSKPRPAGRRGKPQGKDGGGKGGDGWKEPKEDNPLKAALGKVLGATGVQQALKLVRTPYSYVASHVSDIAQEVEQGDVGGAIGALGRSVGGGAIGEIADAVQGKGFDVAGILNSYENEKNRKDFWRQTGVGEYLQRGLDKHTWDDDTFLNDKWVKRGIGFAGEVALDPLTYLTAGSGKLAGSGTQVATRITEAGTKLAARESAEAFAKALASGVDQEVAEEVAKRAAKEATDYVRERAATVVSRGKNRLSRQDIQRLFPDEKVAGGLAWRVPLTGRPTRALMKTVTRGKFVPEEKLIPLLNKNVTNPMQRVLSKPARALGASRAATKLSGKFSGELGQELRKLIRSGDPEQVYKGLGIRQAMNVMRSKAAAGMRISPQVIEELFPENAAKLIVGEGDVRVGPNLAKLWSTEVAPAIKGREDDIMRAIEEGTADTVEGASKVQAFFRAAARSFEEAGIPLGNVPEGEYVPRMFTAEGRRALQELAGPVPEGTVAVDPTAPIQKSRISPQELGVDTPAEARAMLEAMYGKDGKVFETDLHKIGAGYIRYADQQMGRRALLQELEGWGIALKNGEAEKYLRMAGEKTPKVAANNLVNKAMKGASVAQKRRAQQRVEQVLDDALVAGDAPLAGEVPAGVGWLKGRLRAPKVAPVTPEEQVIINSLKEGVTGEPIPASEVLAAEGADEGQSIMREWADAVRSKDQAAIDEALAKLEAYRATSEIGGGVGGPRAGDVGSGPFGGFKPAMYYAPDTGAGTGGFISPEEGLVQNTIDASASGGLIDPNEVRYQASLQRGGERIRNFDTSAEDALVGEQTYATPEEALAAQWEDETAEMLGGEDALDGLDRQLLRRGRVDPQMRETIRIIMKNRKQLPLMSRTTRSSAIDSYEKLGNPTNEMLRTAEEGEFAFLIQQRLLHHAKNMFDMEGNMIQDGANLEMFKQAIKDDEFAEDLTLAINEAAGRERAALAYDAKNPSKGIPLDDVEGGSASFAAESFDMLDDEARELEKKVMEDFMASTDNVAKMQTRRDKLEAYLATKPTLSEKQFAEIIDEINEIDAAIWNESSKSQLELNMELKQLSVEEQWLQAARRYNGPRNAATMQKVKEALGSQQDARLMDALFGLRRQLNAHAELNMRAADEAIRRIENMRSLGYTMIQVEQAQGATSRMWAIPRQDRTKNIIESLKNNPNVLVREMLSRTSADEIMAMRGVGSHAANSYAAVMDDLDAQINGLYTAYRQEVDINRLPQAPRTGVAIQDPEEIAFMIENGGLLKGPPEPNSQGLMGLRPTIDAPWVSSNITKQLDVAWDEFPPHVRYAAMENVLQKPQYAEQYERLINLERQRMRLQNAVLSGDSAEFRKAIILHHLEGAGGASLDIPDDLMDGYVAAIMTGDLQGVDKFAMKMPLPEHPMGRTTPASVVRDDAAERVFRLTNPAQDLQETRLRAALRSKYIVEKRNYDLRLDALTRSYRLYVSWARLNRTRVGGDLVYRTQDLEMLRALKTKMDELGPPPSVQGTSNDPYIEFAEIGVDPNRGRQVFVRPDGTVDTRENIFFRVASASNRARETKNYRSLISARNELDKAQEEFQKAYKNAISKDEKDKFRLALDDLSVKRNAINDRIKSLGLETPEGRIANGRRAGAQKVLDELGEIKTVDDIPRAEELLKRLERQKAVFDQFNEKTYYKLRDKRGNKMYPTIEMFQYGKGRIEGGISEVQRMIDNVKTVERVAKIRKIAYEIMTDKRIAYENLMDDIRAARAEARATKAPAGTLSRLGDEQRAATIAYNKAEKEAWEAATNILDGGGAGVASPATAPAASTQMTMQEFFDLTKRVSAAEKPALAKDIPKELWDLWDEGRNWEAFSRARGYTEEEIADYAKWLEAAGTNTDSLAIVDGLVIPEYPAGVDPADADAWWAKQGAATAEPKANFAMNYAYGTDKRAGVISENTFDAIVAGERTSTTRWNAGDIKKADALEIGDTVGFKAGKKTTEAKVEDVLQITFVPRSTETGARFIVASKANGTTETMLPEAFFEQWSVREGWSVDRAKKFFADEIDKGRLESRQVVFSTAQGTPKPKGTGAVGGMNMGDRHPFGFGPRRGIYMAPANDLGGGYNPVRSATGGSESGQDALNAAAAASEPADALDAPQAFANGDADDNLIEAIDEVINDPTNPLRSRKRNYARAGRDWMKGKQARVRKAQAEAGGDPVVETLIATQSQAENAGILRFMRYPTSDPVETFKRLNNLDSLDEVATMLDDAANEHLAWLQKSQGYFTDRETADMLNRVATVNTPDGVKKFLGYYDKFMTYLKAWQLSTPGFHVRNTMGGIFNNYLAGVELGSTSRFLKNMQKFKAGKLTGEEAEWMKAIYENVGGGQYSHHEIGLASDIRPSKNPFSPRFAPLRGSAKFGGDVEFRMRGALMWDRLSKGRSLQEALDDVTHFHFDYANLSSFETEVVKRVIPFYVWTRYNFPLQLEMLAQSPVKYRYYQQFKQSRSGTEDKGKPVPSFLTNEMFGIPLPLHLGGGQTFLTPDLPFTRTMAGGLPEVDNWDPKRLGTYPHLLDPYFSQMAAPIKLPLELGFSRQFFKGIPLRDTSKTEGYVSDALGPAANFVGGKTKADYLVEQLFPLAGQFRRLVPNEDKQRQRLFTNWASYVGLPLRTNTKQDQENELARRRYLK